MANKLSSDEAVKRVLAGEKGDSRGRAVRTSKAPESDNKGVKEEESRTHKEVSGRQCIFEVAGLHRVSKM